MRVKSGHSCVLGQVGPIPAAPTFHKKTGASSFFTYFLRPTLACYTLSNAWTNKPSYVLSPVLSSIPNLEKKAFVSNDRFLFFSLVSFKKQVWEEYYVEIRNGIGVKLCRSWLVSEKDLWGKSPKLEHDAWFWAHLEDEGGRGGTPRPPEPPHLWFDKSLSTQMTSTLVKFKD